MRLLVGLTLLHLLFLRDVLVDSSKPLGTRQFENWDVLRGIDQFYSLVGEDTSEEECVKICLKVDFGPSTSPYHTWCGRVCAAMQAVGEIGLHVTTTATSQAKRNLIYEGGLQLFASNQPDLREMVEDIVHMVGTDATEQACEGACLSMDTIFCPLICRSLPVLIDHYGLNPTEFSVTKRAVFGARKPLNSRQIFDNVIMRENGLVSDGVHQLLKLVGTDTTQEECLKECHKVELGTYTSDFQTLCDVICRLLSTALRNAHSTTTTSTNSGQLR